MFDLGCWNGKKHCLQQGSHNIAYIKHIKWFSLWELEKTFKKYIYSRYNKHIIYIISKLLTISSISLCLRSLTYGRCTRSVAGSFSLLVTVSGSSTRISSTDLFLAQQTLPFNTVTSALTSATICPLPVCQTFLTDVRGATIKVNRFYSLLYFSIQQEDRYVQLSLQALPSARQSSP